MLTANVGYVTTEIGTGLKVSYDSKKCPSDLTRKEKLGASLVVQWLRVCLPMQGTQVRALFWEDPTCRGATGPVSHNY